MYKNSEGKRRSKEEKKTPIEGGSRARRIQVGPRGSQWASRRSSTKRDYVQQYIYREAASLAVEKQEKHRGQAGREATQSRKEIGKARGHKKN